MKATERYFPVALCMAIQIKATGQYVLMVVYGAVKCGSVHLSSLR